MKDDKTTDKSDLIRKILIFMCLFLFGFTCGTITESFYRDRRSNVSVVNNEIITHGEEVDIEQLKSQFKFNEKEETVSYTVVPETTTEKMTETVTSTSATETKKVTGKININTASKEELDSLPGIGEKIAQSIIDYRTENGDFQSVEELMNVSRIGEKVFAKLKDMVTV